MVLEIWWSSYFVNTCPFFEKMFLNYLVDDFLCSFLCSIFFGTFIMWMLDLVPSTLSLPSLLFLSLSFLSPSFFPPFLLGNVNFLFNTLLDGMSLAAGGRDGSTRSCFSSIQEPSRNGPGLLPQLWGVSLLVSFYPTALSLKCCFFWLGPECSTIFHHKCLYSTNSWGRCVGERKDIGCVSHASFMFTDSWPQLWGWEV